MGAVEVIECHGDNLAMLGVALEELKKINVDIDTVSEAEIEKCKKIAKQKFLVCATLNVANRGRFSVLQENSINDYSKGHNVYPQNVDETYNQLLVFTMLKTDNSEKLG